MVVGLALSALSLFVASQSNSIAKSASVESRRANAVLTCLETTLPGRLALRDDVSSFRSTVLNLKTTFDQNIMQIALDVSFGASPNREMEIKAQRLVVNEVANIQALRAEIPGSFSSKDSESLGVIIDEARGAHNRGDQAMDIIEGAHNGLLAAANEMQSRTLSNSSILGECSAQ